MSCLWTCWKKQTPLKPIVLQDTKIENPLHLEAIPSTSVELKAWEGALIDQLVSVHYKIEETKYKIGNEFRAGRTDRARALIAKNSYLLERKLLFEQRLQRVQKKLAALR